MNKRPGKTLYFNAPYTTKFTKQIAVHLASDNHWSYQVYEFGVKVTKMQRAKLDYIMKIIGISDLSYLRELFA